MKFRDLILTVILIVYGGIHQLHSQSAGTNNPGASDGTSSWNDPTAALTLIRPLSEINMKDISEAYPWLSPDGLRLYFTHGTGQEANQLYVSSRSKVMDSFGGKKTLGSLIPPGSFSSFLSDDELEMWYVNDTFLYYTTRSNISEDFTFPQKIKLNGISGFISGPSLTADKEELYLFNAPVNNIAIVRLVKSGVNEYTFTETLSRPVGKGAGPGQLSKNGLKYYTSLSDVNGYKIVRYSRNSMSEKFASPVTVVDSFGSLKLLHQPTLNLDESLMVCTGSSENTWQKNDLYIAVDLSADVQEINHKEILNIYPNPVQNSITITTTGWQATAIEVYNTAGMLVLVDYVKSEVQKLDLSNLPAGTYFLHMISGVRTATAPFVKL